MSAPTRHGLRWCALLGRGVLEVFLTGLGREVDEFVEAIRVSFARAIAERMADPMGVRAMATPRPDGAVEERFWSATNVPILGGDGSVAYILSTVQEVTREVLAKRSEEARELLMREVDHRARNTLAVVQSILRLTTATDVETFRAILNGRVEALARAQSSLVARRWEGAALPDVVASELATLATGDRCATSPRL